MENIPAIFGSMVFDDRQMKAALTAKVYDSLKKTIDEGKELDIGVANAVAAAMKNFAMEKGATHFTHWFLPLTGITAEKHDSFIATAPNGGVIMEFSGKELIKGEPDASSFPSGGLRSTFEARGYTAWDPTSYAFVKGKTLYIPTAFCSFGGHALDKKTPLLRSMDALNREALRVLRLFGNHTAKCVRASVGAEQEYFLVPKELYDKRPDLRFTGRTLFGALPPKGQELDDHYFGVIAPRVAAFMEEADRELWSLGILAKTEHKEVAPAQHELAPIYSTVNIAADHDQLTMEILKKVAAENGLVCLLHEKPFEGVNGSGKHNNWSLSTDEGQNLLSPGETPYENEQFLLFLCAVIKAVDDYAPLLRISVATAGNDHRLGADEAPPAIVSVFLGDELSAVLDAIEKDESYVGAARTKLRLGVDALPKFNRDMTDRNRTSPFAYTGNKFEFRMVGSSASIADCNIVLNTAVAESLKCFADRLEKEQDFKAGLHRLLRETVTAHRRILFDKNGYDEKWVHEAAEKRGLPNYKTTPDCVPHLLDKENVALFTTHGVFTEAELRARAEVLLETYCKTVLVEARTMLNMARSMILPAMTSFLKSLADSIAKQKALDIGLSCEYEFDTVTSLSALSAKAQKAVKALEAALDTAKSEKNFLAEATFIRDKVLALMSELRESCDKAESYMDKDFLKYPTYADLLFGV